MRTSTLGIMVLCILCVLSAGCSGSTTTPNNGTPMVVAIHDSAPTGVSVLAFTMTISGMSLMDSVQHTTSLISSPVAVQFHDLLTQSALLAFNSAAPPNTYPSMTITFSNVVVTILNASGSTITVGGTSCAPTQICTITPTINQGMTTISSGAFPLTVTDAPFTLDVDLNIGSSLQINLLTVTPFVSVSAPPHVTGILQSFTANGQITGVSGSSFTMTDAATGNSLHIDASKSTFVNFLAGSGSCTTANTAACLATKQNLNVDYIATDGVPTVLQAKNVVLKNGITNGIEGVVIAAPVAGPPNQFTMVVTGTSPTRTDMPIGTKLTVITPTTPSSFAFLPVSGLTVPSPLAFTDASSVVVGQTIDIDSANASASAGTATATTVLLVPSQFIGNLSAINTVGVSSLGVNGLNSIFTTGGVTSLNVLVETETVFQGVPFSSLVVGKPVTAGGEIFRGTSGLTVVGGQVDQ